MRSHNFIVVPNSDVCSGHLWYSRKQLCILEQQNMSFNWAILHDTGKRVKYTEMTRETRPSGLWDDYEYVGYGRYVSC